MENMTLARALRYKKRVIERIRSLETDIQGHNSIIVGSTREFDVLQGLEDRHTLIQHLVNLKLSIQEATKPVQRIVLELAETKSEIAFLQRIDTKHGVIKDQWKDAPPVEYIALIRKASRDDRVKILQKQVDKLQTQLDSHNASVFLEIEVPEIMN